MENREKLTPCELGKFTAALDIGFGSICVAEKNGHKDLAIYLESRMIFSVSPVAFGL